MTSTTTKTRKFKTENGHVVANIFESENYAGIHRYDENGNLINKSNEGVTLSRLDELIEQEGWIEYDMDISA
jgi:hypothetical protein